MPISRFIFNRLLQLLAVILGTVTVLFIVLYLLVPGDAAQAMLGAKATPQALENLRHELGLDRSLPVQYGLYLWRLLHFDLGTSYELNRSVSSVILDYLPATAYLAGAALLLETLAGMAWGFLTAGRRSTRLDFLTTISGSLLLSTPVFFLGMVLQYIFGSRLGILPISGLGGYNPVYLILPATTLAAAQAVIVGTMARSSLELQMARPYFLAARARGLTHRQALVGHGTRNALGPVVTLLAIDLGALMGGAMITEIVFSWPGIGRMTYYAAQVRDVPLIIGSVVVLVAIFVTISTLVDIMYGWLDPRVRLGAISDG